MSSQTSVVQSDSQDMRDQRRKVVVGRIRRAALRLFTEHSFDDVTVDDIAVAAGIAPRTFFRYFASKDDVVLHYGQLLYDRLVDTLAARPEGEGAVTALFQAFVVTSTVGTDEERALILEHGRVLTNAPGLQARAQRRPNGRQTKIVSHLAERMGVAVTDRRPELLAAAMSAVAEQAFERWVRDEGPGDPASRIAEALELVVQGLAGLDGRQQP